MSNTPLTTPLSELIALAQKDPNAPYEPPYKLVAFALQYVKQLAEKVETLEKTVQDIQRRLGNA